MIKNNRRENSRNNSLVRQACHLMKKETLPLNLSEGEHKKIVVPEVSDTNLRRKGEVNNLGKEAMEQEINFSDQGRTKAPVEKPPSAPTVVCL